MNRIRVWVDEDNIKKIIDTVPAMTNGKKLCRQDAANYVIQKFVDENCNSVRKRTRKNKILVS